METDENLSDADLIYVGEEHIDLDEHSVHNVGMDELLVDQDQDQERLICGDIDTDITELEISTASKDNENDANENRDDREISSGKVEGLMIVDEWDDEELNSEDEHEELSEKDKDAINPEDVEKAMLNMPTIKVLMDDIGHFKQNRNVIVSPLNLEDFSSPRIQDILTWATLEETKINYTRSGESVKTFVGIMVLYFTTSGAATKAVEVLKTWREDLNIKVESNSNKIVEDFVADARGKKRWTDNVAILKNLADDVKVESIKELFPQAEEIILHLDTSKRKDSTSTASKDAPSMGTGAATTTSSSSTSTPRGYAYLIFPSYEIVNAEVDEADEKKLELGGHRILLLNYRNPVNSVPRNYLKLRERKVLMKQLDKYQRSMERAKTDPSVKLPEKADERVELCKSLIEKDNECRKKMELPEPSLEELKRMPGLPAMDSSSCQKILFRLGVIKEKRKGSPTSKNDRDKRKDRGPSPRRPSSHRAVKRRNSPNRGRRSPYNSHKRSWGSGADNYRSGRNTGNRTMPPSLLGSATNIVNPLALMMQQNLGMIGTGGVLNPGLMVQPNVAMMGAGAGLLGSQGLPYVGVGGSIDDGKSKMLRLDEAGNFRPTNEPARQYSSSRYDDRMRRSNDDSRLRDVTRGKRSRSPMTSTRSRQDYDLPPSSRSGIDDEVSGPVNLLLNLSQMLSQKMEQKRQLIEKDKRGMYDRDYRGSQR